MKLPSEIINYIFEFYHPYKEMYQNSISFMNENYKLYCQLSITFHNLIPEHQVFMLSKYHPKFIHFLKMKMLE